VAPVRPVAPVLPSKPVAPVEPFIPVAPVAPLPGAGTVALNVIDFGLELGSVVIEILLPAINSTVSNPCATKFGLPSTTQVLKVLFIATFTSPGFNWVTSKPLSSSNLIVLTPVYVFPSEALAYITPTVKSVTPVAPVAPIPVAPVAPNPVAPGKPVAPGDPVAPVAPSYPVAPVGPPEGPVAPCGPVEPSNPVEP
jgi:hypothetical protein